MDCFEALRHHLDKLADYPAIKIMAGFFVWLFAFLFGDFSLVYGAIMFFVVADLITALWFAWVDPDSRIQSFRMKEGVAKLFLYSGALSIAHFCSFVPFLATVEFCTQGAVAATELISLVENAQKLCKHYGVESKLLDLLLKILNGKMKELGGDDT